MKELWKANPFHLMNSPFTEMGYNSSGLNIAPERLLLATRRPSTHHPLASGAAFFDPLRATCRRVTNHLQHTAQHLAAPCKPSAVVLRSTWRPPAQHPSALCMPSARQFTARCPATPASHLPSFCAAPGGPLHSIRHLAANHPSSHGAASGGPCAPSADSLQAICWHEPMSLTTRRTSRRCEQAA